MTVIYGSKTKFTTTHGPVVGLISSDDILQSTDYAICIPLILLSCLIKFYCELMKVSE